jgi:hypothetical protein
MIYAQRTLLSSGRPSAPISATHSYLRVTQEGKQWIANLYAHVFLEEHRGAITGA